VNKTGSPLAPRRARFVSRWRHSVIYAEVSPLTTCLVVLQRRKAGSGNKPRDASNAHGATAAESVRNFVTKNKKFSRKINYSAYDSLFGGATASDTGQDKDDDDDDGLYGMEDKSDGEGMVVVEEEGGGVGARKTVTRRSAPRRSHGDGDGDTTMDASTRADSEEDPDAEGEKDDDAWGAADDVDAYEQEV
jgi:transcription factor IIIB subunit 2